MNKALAADSQIEVVGVAANGEMAIHMASQLKPDIIILDIEMPVMDGITALPQLRAISPSSKIIMASTLTMRNAEISIRALTLGASDYLPKPSSKSPNEVEDFYRELTSKVRALGGLSIVKQEAVVSVPAPVKSTLLTAPVLAKPQAQSDIRALAIASSTGGPQALMSLFEQLKGALTHIPIFITQHMPPTFTRILADHLSKAGERVCIEPKGGEVVAAGITYIAPGDYHMVIEAQGNNMVIRINQDPQENYCRPAADPMLRSLSKIYGKHLQVLVLTGMGQDGLEGSKIVVEKGGSVIAQDEATCVVYGMPKAVVENQLCQAVLPLPQIGQYLMRNIVGRA
jgi:two-component system chemotaxis response regulator CheB